MSVVSDTSAISNLLAIDQIDLLKAIYGDVFITPAVQRELYRIDSNKKLLANCGWIKVMTPNNRLGFPLNKSN